MPCLYRLFDRERQINHTVPSSRPAPPAGMIGESWNIMFDKIWFNNSHDREADGSIGTVSNNTVMIDGRRVELTKGNGWVTQEEDNSYRGEPVNSVDHLSPGPVTIGYDNIRGEDNNARSVISNPVSMGVHSS